MNPDYPVYREDYPTPDCCLACLEDIELCECENDDGKYYGSVFDPAVVKDEDEEIN